MPKQASGNKRLQEIVKNQLEAYAATKSKKERTFLVSNILFRIEQSCLEHDSVPFVKFDGQNWYQVTDTAARTKITATFRDFLHGMYKSSTKSKVAKRRKARKSTSDGHDSSSSTTCCCRCSRAAQQHNGHHRQEKIHDCHSNNDVTANNVVEAVLIPSRPDSSCNDVPSSHKNDNGVRAPSFSLMMDHHDLTMISPEEIMVTSDYFTGKSKAGMCTDKSFQFASFLPVVQLSTSAGEMEKTTLNEAHDHDICSIRHDDDVFPAEHHRIDDDLSSLLQEPTIFPISSTDPVLVDEEDDDEEELDLFSVPDDSEIEQLSLLPSFGQLDPSFFDRLMVQ